MIKCSVKHGGGGKVIYIYGKLWKMIKMVKTVSFIWIIFRDIDR